MMLSPKNLRTKLERQFERSSRSEDLEEAMAATPGDHARLVTKLELGFERTGRLGDAGNALRSF